MMIAETTVMLVDDEQMVREGLRLIMESEPGLTVVAEGADGEEAVALAAEHSPAVIVMDVRMPRCDGLDATRRIVAGAPQPPAILILTTFADDEYVYGALRSGARGFMAKSAPPDELVGAVRSLAVGEDLLSRDETRKLIEKLSARLGGPSAQAEPGTRLADLSPLETTIVRQLAKGRSNPQIADALHYSPHTVNSYVKQILTKLGVSNRVGAVIAAYEGGLVRPGDG